MPRTSPLALLALLGLVACTDYSVTRSELSAEGESAEVTLAPGTSAEIRLRLVADAKAMAAKPTNWVDITVFALMEGDLTPLVSVTAGSESAQVAVMALEYIDVTVQDPLGACIDPDQDPGTVDVTLEDDGGCTAVVPVDLAVNDGTATLQLTAHYELSFGSQSAPGTMAMTVLE